MIAPDSYKESLTAMEVATAIKSGMKKVWPQASFELVPVADGGEGTVQSLVDARKGTWQSLDVRGPLGDYVNGRYGIIDDGQTAVIEMAEASGLHLVPPSKRNPLLTSSFGTGELISDALNLGVTKLILGLGGSATNDGGRGMLAALGAKFLDKDGKLLGAGGAELANLARIDVSQLDPRLAQVQIEVACDVDNPLCGARGASAVFGPQKGATDRMVKQLDQALQRFAEIIEQDLKVAVAEIPGAGAAGGMGAGMLGFTNAQLRPGIDIVMDAVSLSEKVIDADLVVTGEGRIDAQTVYGKTPVGVARIAKQANKKVVAICGCIGDGSHAVYEHGIDAVFDVVPASMTLEQCFTNAADNIERTAEDIARLIDMNIS
ncbi:glycerate kinase [Paraferrimonas haliotis]|uniref:glycerate kinase n=1 Tax=Paraferrimonas haliotis TaxID=2013866 RepID=UPI002FCE495C